jgi:hypothetical protein
MPFPASPRADRRRWRLRFSISQPQAPAGKPVAYVTVFARGLVKHQFTAVFLEDDRRWRNRLCWNRCRLTAAHT